jgi:hypothetical protein
VTGQRRDHQRAGIDDDGYRAASASPAADEVSGEHGMPAGLTTGLSARNAALV